MEKIKHTSMRSFTKKTLFISSTLLIIALLLLTGCVEEKSRDEAIPDDAIKYTPSMDIYPPILHNDAWSDPIPMPGPINTAGAEDACFITPDGNTFLFFFTPDVDVPANEQLLDGVTGIWWCHKEGNTWAEPTRITLSKNLALDGAPFYQDTALWFASFRVGNYGEDGDMWTARYENGKWTDITNAGQILNEAYNIGEMHLTHDGNTMYFHRESALGSGEYDLFTTTFVDGTWTQPVNLGLPISTAMDDSRPFVSEDGTELWFTRTYMGTPAVYRSLWVNDSWAEPELIVSQFAGEPTLDNDRNLYFVHHFFDESANMLEADIYVCYKKW
jgi:hypothetical protein